MNQPPTAPIGRTASAKAQSTAAIARAARATGVDFSYLYNQARIESSLNPAAKARTSSATGLYQFINQTWLAVVDRHGAAHGLGWAANAISRGPDGRYQVADPQLRQQIMELRKNPDAAALMAAEFASDNRRYVESRIGRRAEPVDLYLAHFLGPAGAAKFLGAHAVRPDQSAASLFPQAAAANRGIFYAKDGTPRSLEDVRSRFAAKLEGDSGTIAPARMLGSDAGAAAPIAPNSVMPADYLRIARAQAAGVSVDIAAMLQAIQPGGSDPNGSEPPVHADLPAQAAGATTGPAGAPYPVRPIVQPGEARLAYLMFTLGNASWGGPLR